VGLLLFIALLLYGLARVGQEWAAPFLAAVPIDLAPRSLVLYTFLSLCRGFAALILSLLFTLLYGYVAARVRGADRIMLPVLDVLQSIPVLGFMPGFVLALVRVFPRAELGLELAAVLMIFTGQAWNLTFAFYDSLRRVPPELTEVARVYRLGWLRRFLQVDLAFSTGTLLWNGMMSMAGGWFFLTVNEAFVLGGKDYRLPGVGSYMAVATAAGNHAAMLYAVIAMVIMIVGVDQLFWRPLLAWSHRYQPEAETGTPEVRSWVLALLRHSGAVAWLKARRRAPTTRSRGHRWVRRLRAGLGVWAERLAGRPGLRQLGQRLARFHVGTIVGAVGFGGICLWGAVRLGLMLKGLPAAAFVEIARCAGFTLLRTSAAVILGTLWTVPAGVLIGTSPRLSQWLQPVIQVAASFPAPMLFPLVVGALTAVHVGLGIGSVALMALGTQWYILFNVAAGATSIPQDLAEVALLYRFGWLRRVRTLILPAIFPSLVTGWITAAGGAWNASIVSEYLAGQGPSGQALATPGLGSLISHAAAVGDFPRLCASILAMVILVTVINRLLWRRLQRIAVERFALVR
jgi:NitT/TauT family transport system permease protein